MKQSLTHITIVVDDYDKAIAFYTQKLHFNLIEDRLLSDTKRWVIVKPKETNGCALLLAKAANDAQKSRIGNQTGGRVFLFLHTDSFNSAYQNLIDNDIKIVRTPTVEDYGTVAVFEDVYGNLWDLIEPTITEEYFYSTVILKIKNAEKIDAAIAQLKILRDQTLLENGNISFDIKQLKEDPSKIILWECFKNEPSFKAHLSSPHFQAFLKLEWVEFENVYSTNHIE